MKRTGLLLIAAAILFSSCNSEESTNNSITQGEDSDIIFEHLTDKDGVPIEIKAKENQKKDKESFGKKNSKGEFQWKFIDYKVTTESFYHDVCMWVIASEDNLTIIRDVWNSSTGVEYEMDEHDYRTEYKILSYNKSDGIHYYTLELLSGIHKHTVPSIQLDSRIEYIAISNETGALDHYFSCVDGDFDRCSGLDRMLNFKNQPKGQVSHSMEP